MPDRTLGLSERQKQCLRLVAQGQTSKEIAPVLDTTPGVVDNYIQAAVRLLGVTSRREAARCLIDWEMGMVQRLHVQPPAVATEPIYTDLEDAPTRESDTSPLRSGLVRKVAKWLLGQVGGSRHDRSAAQSLLAIGVVALVTSALLACTIAIFYWLNHLFS